VLTALVLITPLTAPAWQSLLVSTAFVVSCAASSFALLALFLRVGGSRSLAWRGLRESAYGIYLVHFAVAAWVHYTLLGWAPGALAKGAVAFAVTLAVSWTAVSTLRRMPWLKEIL
jgi:peptidoglycan/LPS O-acetylase OafA/YrhL